MRITRRLVYCLVAFTMSTLLGCPPAQHHLVLYCAQDQEFAEDILADYKKETGVTVTPKFDTESTKSVSLVVEIEREKGRPRCDVFWNNEIVSTIRLQKQGLLLPYESPSAKPFPERTKAKDHTWQAFATRARVLIVNKDKVAEKDWPHSLFDLTDAKWRDKAVMAKPEFGTSATQAACLFEVLGADKARDYYHGLKTNGIQIAPGNKQAAEWVAAGKSEGGKEVLVGVTDTDDAMDQIKAGKPVAVIFPDRNAPKNGKMGTLFIPNTLCIIKDCRHPEEAKKLVDYLLSAKIEEKLAEGDSHQIPLNPEVKAKLPKEMADLEKIKHMDVDFEKAAELWDKAQEFLKEEFAR
jgi:iron(III) transport system substrate-binding protein